MDRPLTIVIPVYNEGANFPALWAEMTEHLDFPFTAFVAYDFDGDNTLPVVQQIIAEGETRLKLIKNTYGRGVVGAIRTGFDAAPPVLCWWSWPTSRMIWGRFARCSNSIGRAATLLSAAAT